MTDTPTETDISPGEVIRREDIARNLITRHVGRLIDAWINIGALQDNYPEATSDHDWEVLSQIQNELTDILQEKENG